MGLVGLSYALSQGVVAKPLIRLAGRNTSRLIICCMLLLGGCRPFAFWTTSAKVARAPVLALSGSI